MKKLVWLLMAFAFCSWATPKPMERIENYNVLMVHGAYGTDKGVSENGECLSSYVNIPVKINR